MGFSKTCFFPKLWSHFLGFFFLILFSLQNKNKIGGDSNFSKINFSQIKSESRRSSGGACEKCGSTVSATIQCNTPIKYKDSGCPTISVNIGDTYVEKALLDLGASVNLRPYSVYKQLG